MELIDFCGLHRICQKILVLAQMGIVHPPQLTFPSVKKRKGGHLHPCRQPPLVLCCYSISQSLKILSSSLFIFHSTRLGKFQRIGLTDMVGGDAVILCKAQNVADGNAVDDLGRGKSIDLLGKDFLS